MKLADVVFYGSVAGLVWNVVQQQVHSLVTPNAFAFISLAFTTVAAVTFALYEKLNGDPIIPPQP